LAEPSYAPALAAKLASGEINSKTTKKLEQPLSVARDHRRRRHRHRRLAVFKVRPAR